jgi:hypothetical protein
MLSVLLRPLKDRQQLHLQLTTFAAATVGATRGKKNLNKLANDAAAGIMLCDIISSNSSPYHGASLRYRASTPGDSRQCSAEAEKKRRRRAEKARLRAWTAEASWDIRVDDARLDSQPMV